MRNHPPGLRTHSVQADVVAKEREHEGRTSPANASSPMDATLASLPLAEASPSPARQLLQLLETSAPELKGPYPVPSELQQTGGIRVLRMKLSPEALGDVDVTMRRSRDGLRIEVTVANQAVTKALQADIEFLKARIGGLLHSGSTGAVSIIVQSADSGTTGPSPLPPAAGGDQAMASAFSSGHGGRPSSHKEDAPFRFRGSARHEEEVPLRPVAASARVV